MIQREGGTEREEKKREREAGRGGSKPPLSRSVVHGAPLWFVLVAGVQVQGLLRHVGSGCTAEPPAWPWLPVEAQ